MLEFTRTVIYDTDTFFKFVQKTKIPNFSRKATPSSQRNQRHSFNSISHRAGMISIGFKM